MKKIILILALVAGWTTFAQNSEYNKNRQFGKEFESDTWFNIEGNETLFYKQNTVGFFHSSQEIKKVLTFYSLDFNKPIKDETLLPSFTTIDDYQTMSSYLLMNNATVFKIWYTETHIITWNCDNKVNQILIMQKQK